ncbi:hypothetical protein R1sor_013402 [Riccia sorocarpa]|uniref:Remorin C-terminal domain-containing protein n=1 Tax=Riccia sorocarpa TaxID=122646 RepID=A0ABD3H6F6_9MARC
MEAAQAAGESVQERERLPVSPSDPMYFHAPANVSSRAATFGLHRNGVEVEPNLNFPLGGMMHRGIGVEGGPSSSFLTPSVFHRTGEDEVPGTEAPMSELNDIPVEHGISASEFESGRHSSRNSGKMKKDVSKSAHAIVSAMNNFSDSFVSVEEKREERESQKQKFTVETEERHFKWMMDSEERRENTKASRSKEMVYVLSVLAGAFTDIASTFRGRFQDKDA